MKKVIKLNESDIYRMVKRVLTEQDSPTNVGKKEEPINQKDEQGRNQGFWVHEWNGKRREVYYKDGKWHGSFKQWHPNGKLSMEGEGKDGRESGIWKIYYDNGRLKRELTYNEGGEVIEKECWNKNGEEMICRTEIVRKPYTFTDGKGKKYQGEIKDVYDDYSLDVTIDGLEHLVCGTADDLELYIDKKNKKWVLSQVDCGKKTQKEFLKFTNGGLIQDELLSLAPWKRNIS